MDQSTAVPAAEPDSAQSVPQIIRAAVLEEFGTPPMLRDLFLSEPEHDEVVVRLQGCGICHTDIAVGARPGRVPVPIVLGHEGVGIVERLGSGVRDIAVGDRVVMSFAHCGRCSRCRSGLPSYCERIEAENFGGAREDGSVALRTLFSHDVHSHFFGQSSLATAAVCNTRNLVRVEHDLPTEILAPLGCGIQTGAGAIFESLKVGPGAAVCVLGAGAVGLSAVMACAVVGASDIVAVDLDPRRLALARDLGATADLLAGRGTDPGHMLRDHRPDGFDFVLDTTGDPDVINAGISALAARGICGLTGMPKGMLNLNVKNLMSGGRAVRGILEGDSNPRILIPRLIDLYRKGRFPVNRLVSTFDFEALHDAWAGAVDGSSVKAVLMMRT